MNESDVLIEGYDKSAVVVSSGITGTYNFFGKNLIYLA